MLEREGQELRVVVVESSDEGIKLDANHPLAGETLTFEIQVHSVQAES